MEEERKSPVGGSADVSRRMASVDEPRPLPYSDYPTASDVAQHGVQPLPTSLPLVDFAQAKPYRSSRYSTILEPELTKEQLLQMAWVIASGFARREPQARYLQPPKHPPQVSWRRSTPILSEPTRSVRGTHRHRCIG